MKRLVLITKLIQIKIYGYQQKEPCKHLKYLRFKQENKIILDTIIKIFENKKLKHLN